MGQPRHATIYVDYQQRAREFSVGDLAYPLAGGSTDESQAGRVVAVWPAIGQVDIEFAWGSGRYGVEDLQRVTSIVAIPPNPEHTTVPGGTRTVPVSGSPRTASIDRLARAWVKQSLYWASADRHYQATKAELDAGSYTCPKCKEGTLKHAVYKRSEGKSEKLLGCPSCLFLIKRCDIIGDPDYEDGEYVAESDTAEGADLVAGKKASEKDTIAITFEGDGWSRGSHHMLEGETWDEVGTRLARGFDVYLTSYLASVYTHTKYKGRGVFQMFFEAPKDDAEKILDAFERCLGREFQDHASSEYSYLVLGPPDQERVPHLKLEVM